MIVEESIRNESQVRKAKKLKRKKKRATMDAHTDANTAYDRCKVKWEFDGHISQHLNLRAENPHRPRLRTSWSETLKIYPRLNTKVRQIIDASPFKDAVRLCIGIQSHDFCCHLVERWRPETHTFSFPCCEMGITPLDVYMLLGLRFEGIPITSLGNSPPPEEVAVLLGDFPPPEDTRRDSEVTITWLRTVISQDASSAQSRLFNTSIFKTLRPSASDGISPRVAKYWYQRYSLFSRYDDGIKMDEEGWFSVTPEDIAIRHAERSGPGVVIDCFAGVGGNSIQFARRCNYVLAIEIDPQKVGMAFNNAKIYGVENYIDFIVGDFFQLAPFLKGDVVFLSPPWGGPTYSGISNYTLDLLKPKDGYSMFQVAQRITPNVIMFLPRNVDSNQVEELSWLSSPPLNVEIEESYVGSYMKGVSAYFGDTAWRSPAVS